MPQTRFTSPEHQAAVMAILRKSRSKLHLKRPESEQRKQEQLKERLIKKIRIKHFPEDYERYED